MTKQEILESERHRVRSLKLFFDVLAAKSSSCSSSLANYEDLSLKEVQDMFYFLTTVTDCLAKYMLDRIEVNEDEK